MLQVRPLTLSGIAPGALLAQQPRAITGTEDITGGLPRVTEVFEARRPKEQAEESEVIES